MTIARIALAGLLGAAVFSTGCVNRVPSFRLGDASVDQPPDLDDLLREISCELREAGDKLIAETGHSPTDGAVADLAASLGGDEKTVGAFFQKHQYVVAVDLLIEITQNEGLTPTLNYIHLYGDPSTNFTKSIGGKLNQTRHRTFSFKYTLNLFDPKEIRGACAVRKLRGNLELDGIVLAGLRHSLSDYPVYAGFELRDAFDKSKIGAASSATAPLFGSTMDFQIDYGTASTGPTWTLKGFKGGSGSNGLVGLGRTSKNTIVMSFAPGEGSNEELPLQILQYFPWSQAGADARRNAAIEAAARAAQDNNTRMILQNILPR